MAKQRRTRSKMRTALRKSPLAQAVKKGAKQEFDRDMERIRKKASVTLDKAQLKFKTAEKKVQRYIKTHPEKAALIAAGIGAAIGAAIASAVRKGKRVVRKARSK